MTETESQSAARIALVTGSSRGLGRAMALHHHRARGIEGRQIPRPRPHQPHMAGLQPWRGGACQLFQQAKGVCGGGHGAGVCRDL